MKLWNFQRGGGVLEKISSMGEVWIIYGTTQIWEKWKKTEIHQTQNPCYQFAKNKLKSLLIPFLDYYPQNNPGAAVSMKEDPSDGLSLLSMTHAKNQSQKYTNHKLRMKHT